jgi:uncharacterized protein YbjT (DUF2867 family)
LLKSKCKYTFASSIIQNKKHKKMKYIITGSTGHISKPLTQQLTAAGHEVTVITSNASRTEEIEGLGAKAAVGSVEDRDFLIKTFAGADAVYLMIPPNFGANDWFTYQKAVADNYIAAALANKPKYVLILSSVGAHMGSGCGPVDGAAYLEKESEKLTDSQIHILRPSYFFNNLFSQIGMIKHAGIVGSTQPADFKLILVDPSDIANAAAAHLLHPDQATSRIEYVASEDTLTWTDITKAIGVAIGKTDLPFVQFTDEQSHAGMLQAGLSKTIADGYTQMGKALRDGDMQADYWRSGTKATGKVKLADFVKVFAAAYSAQ